MCTDAALHLLGAGCVSNGLTPLPLFSKRPKEIKPLGFDGNKIKRMLDIVMDIISTSNQLCAEENPENIKH